MKRIFTLFLFAVAVSVGAHAVVNAGYNDFKLTTWNQTANATVASDTNYVGLLCRAAQYQCPASSVAGTLYAMAFQTTGFDGGDSIAWKVVRGAPLGTIPRVRFVNAKTGEYLYMGLMGGTAQTMYVAPADDPFNGTKDFELREQGVHKNAMCYFICNGAAQVINGKAGSLGVKNNAGVGWKFIDRKGPQPFVQQLKPTLALNTTSTLYPTLDAVLNAQVTGAGAKLPGMVTLYRGTTILDTLELDAEGKASFTVKNLVLGEEKFVLVYNGDASYGASDSVLTLKVVNNPAAKKGALSMDLPATAEAHQEVTANFTATCDGAAVTAGWVDLFINGVKKNTLTIDPATGKASIVLPVFGTKTYNVWAQYIGEGNLYLNSDTVKKTITVTPTTAVEKPYPVTFDLAQQPLIEAYLRKNITATTTRPFTHAFPKDSVPGIALEIDTAKITYVGNALSYAGTDYKNLYMRADNISVPLGNGLSGWMELTTPWVNKGNYNIYLASRWTGEVNQIITSVTLDGKELYYPEKEYNGRFLFSWNARNTLRRWSSNFHNGNTLPLYLGTVNIPSSDVHKLKVTIKKESGNQNTGELFDFLQIVPVDQDSVDIGLPVATSFAKIYKPVFDMGGFAFDTINGGSKSFSDISEFAVPFQVADPTVYTKTSKTITGLGNTAGELVGNYVTVYRKDQWTRMAEGAIDETNKSFTCELPNGDYYYQEINYIDLGTPGAAGLRTFVSEGTFNIGGSGVQKNRTTALKPYVAGRILNINDLEAGTRIRVYDVAGNLVDNAVVTGTSYSRNLKPAVYIVNIISRKENSFTKLLVK